MGSLNLTVQRALRPVLTHATHKRILCEVNTRSCEAHPDKQFHSRCAKNKRCHPQAHLEGHQPHNNRPQELTDGMKYNFVAPLTRRLAFGNLATQHTMLYIHAVHLKIILKYYRP